MSFNITKFTPKRN